MKYVVFEFEKMSDLEFFNVEANLSVQGYVRLDDRGEFAIFKWQKG